MLSKKNLLLWKVASRRLEETPEEYAVSPELVAQLDEIQTQLGYDREELVRSRQEQRRGYIPDKSLPPELLAVAGELGCDITVETFPAEGFTQRFQEATQQNLQPDILAFVDRGGIIEGFSSHLGEFQGLNTIDGVEESLVFVSNGLRACSFLWRLASYR